MIYTSPPSFAWMDMEFFCPTCEGGFQIEMSDFGAAVRTLPKLIDGNWSVQMSCPYCRHAGFPRTRKVAARE